MNGVPSSTFFSAPPDWGWLIVLYFFFGGLAGGCYFLAVLIDLFGRPEDRPLARLGLLHRVPVPRDQRISVDCRSDAAGALLAYADPVEHLSADVQAVVADVARLLGAADIRFFCLSVFYRSARRRPSSQVAAGTKAAPAAKAWVILVSSSADFSDSMLPATRVSCLA